MHTQGEVQGENPLPAREKGKKSLTFYLGALAVVLALTVGGVFFYLQQQASRFEAQCRAGEQMAIEIKALLEEVKDLPGEADNEVVQDWLGKLDTAQGNMDKFSEELKKAHPGSKYRGACSNLLTAAEIEKTLLEDIEAVVKEPLASDVQDKIKTIDDEAVDLQEQSAAVNIEGTDFATVMNLTDVKDNLGFFVAAAKEAERRRLEEEARIAQEKEKQRLAGIQTRLNSYNDSRMANTKDMEWLATGVVYKDSHRLDLHGFFYNGSNHPVVRVNNMTLSLILYKHGEIVYENDNFYFSDVIDMHGSVAPGTKKFNDLYITTDDEFPWDFDEFRVKTENIHWTYIH